MVSEADAAATRAIFDKQGEESAAVELCRLFPVIADTAQAWDARAIAGRKPLPVAPRSVRRSHQGRGREP